MTDPNPSNNGTATGNDQPEANGRATLPLNTVPDGAKGHGADGRFVKGNGCARGNPFARRMAALRSALLDELGEDDIRALVRQLHKQALDGDVAAATLLFRYTLGRPAEAVDPDTLDLDEWRKLSAMPSDTEVVVAIMDGITPQKAFDTVSRLKEKQPGDIYGRKGDLSLASNVQELRRARCRRPTR